MVERSCNIKYYNVACFLYKMSYGNSFYILCNNTAWSCSF